MAHSRPWQPAAWSVLVTGEAQHSLQLIYPRPCRRPEPGFRSPDSIQGSFFSQGPRRAYRPQHCPCHKGESRETVEEGMPSRGQGKNTQRPMFIIGTNIQQDPATIIHREMVGSPRCVSQQFDLLPPCLIKAQWPKIPS